MKQCIFKAILLILVSLVLLNIAYAANDFLAYSKNSTFSICPCGQMQDTITIINPTDSYEEFIASVSGSAAGFVKINPSHFRVFPRQSAYIVSSLNISCDTAPGSYDFLVKLTTNGTVKGFRQSLVVKDTCFDYSVFLGKQLSMINQTKQEKFVLEKQFPYEFCQQVNSVIPIYLKNNGSFANTFSVSLTAKKWASFFYPPIELKAQQGAILFINIYPPKDLEGDYTFTLSTTTEIQPIKKQIPIDVKLENCYNPLIADNINKLKINYSTIKTILPLKNTGIKNATYVLSVQGEDWISVQPSLLFVEAGEEKNFFVQTQPGEDVKGGNYKAYVTTTVKEDGVTSTKTLTLALSKGFTLFTYFKDIFTKLYILIKGYLLYVLGGIIVVVLFVFILRVLKKREKKKEPSLVKPSATIPLEKEEEAEKLAYEAEKEPLRIPWGAIIGIVILAAILFALYLLITKIPWKAIFSWIFGILGLYKLYILVAIAVIIIAVLVMLVIRQIKKQRKKRESEKEEKKEEIKKEELKKEAKKPEFEIGKEPRKFPWGTIVGIIILAAIIYGIYLLIAKFPWKRMFNWILGFLGIYKWYFLVALALIAVAVIIMLLIKRIKQAKKERKEKEREERRLKRELRIKAKKQRIVTKRKQLPTKYIALFVIIALIVFLGIYFRDYLHVYLWYVIIGILLMIILVFGIMIAGRRKKKRAPQQRKKMPFRAIIIVIFVLAVVAGIGFLYTIGLRSQIIEQENVTTENVTSVPAEKSITQLMYKNTQTKLNLNDFFKDPDKDVLHFVVTPPEHLAISIDDNGIATVIPEKDWIGTTSAVFIADDGKGGIIEGKITFVVKEESKIAIFFNNAASSITLFFSNVKIYIVNYFTYIIVGFIILIGSILLIKFHKPILDFFNEEEKPAKISKKK